MSASQDAIVSAENIQLNLEILIFRASVSYEWMVVFSIVNAGWVKGCWTYGPMPGCSMYSWLKLATKARKIDENIPALTIITPTTLFLLALQWNQESIFYCLSRLDCSSEFCYTWDIQVIILTSSSRKYFRLFHCVLVGKYSSCINLTLLFAIFQTSTCVCFEGTLATINTLTFFNNLF